MAGCDIRSVYAGIAGSHIRSLNSHGIVAIKDSEVTQLDVDRVIDAARAVAIPADQKILHILPQEFVIDNQGGIREPINMSGVRLEAKVHMVTGAVSAAQNITKSVRRCGLDVSDIILEQLASSHSVLTDDEKELGVCLIDIGGGTTDIAIFSNGAIKHTAVIPIAGDQVTNDIAMALRTPTNAAEDIKCKYATVVNDKTSSNKMIEVPSINERPGRKISIKALSEVVTARYEELFDLVKAELERSGFSDLIAAGMVVTGGAGSVLGVVELAEVIFEMPVRLGRPQQVDNIPDLINEPSYATSVGLLLYGLHQQYDSSMHSTKLNPGFKSVLSRMRDWFQGNF